MNPIKESTCCFGLHNSWLVASVCGLMILAGCADPASEPALGTKEQPNQVQSHQSNSHQKAQSQHPQGDAGATAQNNGDVEEQKTIEEKKVAGKTDSITQNGKSFDQLSKPISLFDGKTIEYWEEIEFGGEGSIEVDEGVIKFEPGDPFTGVSSTLEDLPRTNFEVSLEARKTGGVDFFCGLTFPVADSHCTLILGGWGGDVCGLSCIDERDASTNDTSTSMVFKKGQWYKIRVRVKPDKISAWVDDKQIVDANIAGKMISLRGDTTLCEPLGIASFQTRAEYRKIELRKIKVKEDPERDAEEDSKEDPKDKLEIKEDAAK